MPHSKDRDNPHTIVVCEIKDSSQRYKHLPAPEIQRLSDKRGQWRNCVGSKIKVKSVFNTKFTITQERSAAVTVFDSRQFLQNIMIAENGKIPFESNLQPSSQVNRGIKQLKLDFPLPQNYLPLKHNQKIRNFVIMTSSLKRFL